MPKFVHFDAVTGAILNWMDTDAYSYPEVPESELLAISDEQYEARGNLMVQGGALVPYAAPAPTLDQVKAAKLAELARECSTRIETIKAGYPAEEVQSWGKQESEARAYTASSSAATPLLSALATARGITLADLAPRVIAKADLFAAASGAIIGKRQHYEDQVTAATDVATVEAIVWQD